MCIYVEKTYGTLMYILSTYPYVYIAFSVTVYVGTTLEHGKHEIFKLQYWSNMNYPRDNLVSLINEPRARTRRGGRFDLQPTVRSKNISYTAYVLHSYIFVCVRVCMCTKMFRFTCVLMGVLRVYAVNIEIRWGVRPAVKSLLRDRMIDIYYLTAYAWFSNRMYGIV